MPRDVLPPAKTLDHLGVLLHQMADLISYQGHTKDVLQDTAGGLCIYGAYSMALNHGGDPWSTGSLYYETADALAQRLGFANCNQVCRWNNAPERTEAEVLARLRACA